MTHFRQKVKCFTRSSGNFFIRKVNRKKTKNAKAASVIVRTSRMCFNCAPIPSHKKTVLADGFLMAGVTGLEPATSCVTGRRSNQLSYTPMGRFLL